VNIAVFAGHRADWSHLEHVCTAIPDRQLIVTDALLNSITEGIADVHCIVTVPPTRTLLETVESMGAIQGQVARILSRHRPRALLLYGDRSETAAAAIAGSTLGLPVAHIEGGDETYGGCPDDNFRHAITKLASLHFATNSESAIRIVNMGEEAWRVHEVGLPVLDCKPADDVRERYGVAAPILYCEHPVGGVSHMVESMAALGRLHDEGYDVIAIRPNGDAGSDLGALNRLRQYHSRVQVFGNIPTADYHGLLSVALCVVGNSSAGIKEAPAFGCPCINVGERQKGRLRGANVVDVPHDSEAIYAAIKRCDDLEWRGKLRRSASPYGRGGASKKIAEVLRHADFSKRKKVAA
jgi:UDP-hydrolysing UDP-N-acetyl-D-glucosamine 2-epimerase